jgi:hypothetical protein
MSMYAYFQNYSINSTHLGRPKGAAQARREGVHTTLSHPTILSRKVDGKQFRSRREIRRVLIAKDYL